MLFLLNCMLDLGLSMFLCYRLNVFLVCLCMVLLCLRMMGWNFICVRISFVNRLYGFMLIMIGCRKLVCLGVFVMKWYVMLGVML